MLTHLDATGREAVGTVLRAMVSRHDDRAADVFSGSSGGGAAGDTAGSGVATDGAATAPLVIEEGDGVVTEETPLLTGAAGPGRPRSRSRAEALQLSRSLLGGGAYETVLVILQVRAASRPYLIPI